MNTTCIAILGMHRSGTSALTRALNLCGVALPGQMMDNTEGNASGHWEPLEVVAIHDDLLTHHHLAWDDAGVGFTDVFDASAAQVAQARITDFLRPHIHHRFFAVKDPRLCNTLPLWEAPLHELGVDAVAIFATRHPLAVAKSLLSRNQMPLAHGILLWMQYTLAAELHSRNWRRVVVHYDHLIHDWRQSIDPLMHWLGLPNASADTRISTQLDDFLQPNQRHHQSDDYQLAQISEAASDARALWHVCQQDIQLPHVRTEFDHIRMRFHERVIDLPAEIRTLLDYARQRYHRDLATHNAEITWRRDVQQHQAEELAWRKHVMIAHNLVPN
jgi:hypothetical protein